MTLRWTMESVWAAAAVLVSTLGGIWTTSYHWGKANDQIQEVRSHDKDQDKKIDDESAILAELQRHDAAVEQKLDDAVKGLDRLESKLK